MNREHQRVVEDLQDLIETEGIPQEILLKAMLTLNDRKCVDRTCQSRDLRLTYMMALLGGYEAQFECLDCGLQMSLDVESGGIF